MNGNKKNFIVVHIKAVEGQEKNFLAFLQSEVLKSTFFLFFNDDIMGAIALNHFANMLSKEYDVDVKLQLLIPSQTKPHKAV